MAKLEYDDIQGFVFSGYVKRMRAASYHLLHVADRTKAKAWLKELTKRVTRAVSRENVQRARAHATCLNVAFTQTGLVAFGLDPVNDLVTFERGFQEGMASKLRSRILGDDGPSKPSEWLWGNEEKPVDVMLMLFAENPQALSDLEGSEAKAYESGGLAPVVAPIQATELMPPAGSIYSREHFGFADGISQPLIREHVASDTSNPNAIAAGEFILGYANEYSEKGYSLETEVPYLAARREPWGVQATPSGRGPEFGRNGTYLAVRQFRQNVAEFWKFLRTQAGGDAARATYLAAKIIGRWPSGALVKDGQTSDPGGAIENGFIYADNDPDGYGTPIGSHIRRSNPRGVGLGATTAESLAVANRHRLMRRGRSYGPRIEDPYQDDSKERGLFFIALNANIERQFEFIQHAWMNTPFFGTLYDEVDPLIGDPSRTVSQQTDLTIPEHPLRRRVQNIPQIVTVRAGSYFFLPGIHALEILSG
jgi:Dyp-type peroxidase family